MASSNTLTLPSIQNTIRSQYQPPTDSAQPSVAQTTVPDSLIDAVIAQESSGRPSVTGKSGEVGLMQITPAVAQKYGVALGQLYDPATNRRIGSQYLNDLLHQFNGNIGLALAAYNAGPERVKQGAIPESTRKYVWDVLGRLGKGVERAITVGDAWGGETGDAWSHAKAIEDPWTKSKPVADPWKIAAAAPPAPKRNRIEAGYEDYVRDPLRKAISYDPTGITQKYAPGVSEGVGRFLVPDTATGAAVNAALMVPGLGEAGLLTRLAAPTLAGAIAAKASGGSPAGGAIEGGLSALGGEAAGVLGGAIGRLAGKEGILSELAGNVGRSLSDYLPKDMAAPKSAADLERMFTRGQVVQEVSRATAPAREQIANVARGVKFTVPVVKRSGKILYDDLSLPEAEDALTRMSELGYTKGGDIRTMVASRDARMEAYRARGQIAAKLNQMTPGLGDQWLANRKAMGAAQTFKRLFDPSNDIFEGGHVNQPNLVRAILDNYDDLARNIGPDGAEKLLRDVRRGAAIGSDVPSEKPHIGLRAHLEGVYPHLSPGHTYQPVGNVPGYMVNKTYRLPVAVALRRLLEKAGESY